MYRIKVILTVLAVGLAVPSVASAGNGTKYVKKGAAKITAAPGATSHGLAPSMQRYMDRIDKKLAAKAKKHPTARAAAHGYEWPGSPWGGTVPEHSLDCIDSATRDDPPICASRTLDRYESLAQCPGGIYVWWGNFYPRGNSPAATSNCRSTTYFHASVAEETLGWYVTGNYYYYSSPLMADCAARIGNPTGSFRIIATQYTSRSSNTLVRPVVYVAINGVIPGVQPYATACVYSTPGTTNMSGPDSNIGIPSGTAVYYGATSWG